jgi:hypothetical protein
MHDFHSDRHSMKTTTIYFFVSYLCSRPQIIDPFLSFYLLGTFSIDNDDGGGWPVAEVSVSFFRFCSLSLKDFKRFILSPCCESLRFPSFGFVRPFTFAPSTLVHLYQFLFAFLSVSSIQRKMGQTATLISYSYNFILVLPGGILEDLKQGSFL